MLSEESLRQKGCERCAKYEALHLAEVKEREQQKQKERLLNIEREKARAKDRAEKEFAVEMTQQCNDAEFDVTAADKHCSIASDTSPIVLDSVLPPISEPATSCTSSPVHSARCKQLLESARKERDRALSLATLHRDMAETSQAQKRILK